MSSTLGTTPITRRRCRAGFPLLVAVVFCLGPLAGIAAAGWTVLFDGVSTAHFRGYQQPSFPTNSWVIDHGALKAVPGHPVDLITRETFQNFEFEVQWKIGAGCNSGLIYNVVEGPPETWMSGAELQIQDEPGHRDSKNPKTTVGSLYALKAPSSDRKVRPAGRWNTARVVIRDRQVEHWLNGRTVLEYQWGSDEMKLWIASTKFKNMPLFARSTQGGHIALQHHNEEVWYRRIRVRTLPP